MKVFYKVCIKLAIVLIVIGGILALAGVANGASWHKVNKTAWWFDFGPMNRTIEQTTTEVSFESSETGIIEDHPEYGNVSDYDEVSAIQIDIDFGTVFIKEGNEFKVESKNVTSDDFQSYMDGSTLIVETDMNYKIPFFDFSDKEEYNSSTPEITIYIPKGFHADEIDITLGVAYMEIEKISADNIMIDVDAGSVNAQTIIASEEGDFSVGAGEIKIRNINAMDAQINCGVGSIKMEGKIIGDSSVNCGVGKVELLMNGNERDYNYYVDCGMGMIKLNNRKYGASESAIIENDNAANDLTVNCDLGSVIINIK